MNFYFTYFDLKENKELTIKKKFPGTQLIVEKAHNKFITKLKNFHFY